MVQQLIPLKNFFLRFYQRHMALVSIATFAFGFIFDIFTLKRIDHLFNLIQHASYLLILGTLIIFEIKIITGTLRLSTKGKRFWEYHELLVHFLFGSLLRANTIFYFTSASVYTSFFFILLLALMMLANELPRIQKAGLIARVTLFSICLLSYFSFFYPILMKRVGELPFWLGFVSSLTALTLIWAINFRHTGEFIKKNVILPSVAIHAIFLIAYYTSLIPPVPVAIKKMGVYFEVTKHEGKYIGKHTREFWSIFDKWSQEIETRPGDKVVVLLSIFSPTAFEDKIFLKWYFHDPQSGWHLEDTIPLTILGGRTEGFRGYGYKEYYHAGKWRVLVETTDGREVGRLNILITKAGPSKERHVQFDIF